VHPAQAQRLEEQRAIIAALHLDQLRDNFPTPAIQVRIDGCSLQPPSPTRSYPTRCDHSEVAYKFAVCHRFSPLLRKLSAFVERNVTNKTIADN
jgi:hypothetical protein